ncbi:MAG: 5'-3' exonuclease [Actinomycetia bacterium]|nr:5'-3' exonuclease [Actinomycetes bacterium]
MFVHLLDGTYELFRAYFGFPSRTAPDGTEVGAVYGLMNTTLSLLRDPQLTHIAAATDTVIESFRNDMYDGYKTGVGVPEDLMGQFGLAERAFQALGVTVWGMIDFEADDAMATGAHRFSPQADRVILVSPDKDLTQCVSGRHVVTFDRRQNVMLDADGVVAKFGVAPASIPDYLALVGDSADGIPGIPAWGAKSSSTVLGHYGHLEFIPADPANWEVKVRGAARLSKNLNERQEEALLFRELTTLRRDAPVSLNLEEIAWQGVRRTEYQSLCSELGFRNPPSVHRWDPET